MLYLRKTRPEKHLTAFNENTEAFLSVQKNCGFNGNINSILRVLTFRKHTNYGSIE